MALFRILAVDDELVQLKIVSSQVEKLGFTVETAQGGGEALEKIRAKDFDVVLLDIQMPEIDGFQTLDEIKKLEDAPEVIMLTLDDSLESGIAAMRAGAYDYIIKPARSEALETTIIKAGERRRLARHNSNLRDLVKSRTTKLSAVTLPVQASEAMKKIIEQADAIAPLASTVMITGESGTGKDVLARYIHNQSPRCDEVMISVNCGAMPENLFESEFFGYEKGSFTGADKTKRGLLEAADGSTLFLDEIGDMPPNLQVKLLRFLESGWFRRVGGTRDLYVDTRIIAATNRDLKAEVENKTFRSDLFYRLNVIDLHIRSLRERPEDREALIDHFVELFRGQFNRPGLYLTDAARRKLKAYDYPGNVRELKNVIERAAALTSIDAIEDDRVFFAADKTPDLNPTDISEDSAAIPTLDEIERRHILSVLDRTNGNRERAAEVLGISERTLYRRILGYEQASK